MIDRTSSARCASILLLLASIFGENPALAAIVETVKGDKVLIEPESDKVFEGDQFYALDNARKKRAIITITKKREDGRFVGTIEKGKVKDGYILVPRYGTEGDSAGASSAESSMGSAPDSLPPPTKKKKFPLYVGAAAAFHKDSLDLKVNNSSVATGGSGFSVGAVLDMDLSPRLGARGLVSYETFKADGTAPSNVCADNTSKECSTSITFLSLDSWAKFRFLRSAWAGLGFGFRVPLSASSTALAKNSIISIPVVMTGLGWDMKSGKNRIPIQLDYGLFLSNSDVSTTIISVRAGWLFAF